MNLLVPLTITPAMLASSTIAEPDSAMGEAVWNPATAYNLGDQVILTATHRVYINVLAGTSAISPDNIAAGAANIWQDIGPTNKYAAFDQIISTQSKGANAVTNVIRPGGFFNAIDLFGCDGQQGQITVKDAPGGNVIASYVGPLQEPPLGWWEYFFAPRKPITKLLIKDIPLAADPEVTITVSAPGATAAVGIIVLGDLRALAGSEFWAGTVGGASADPKTYSYIATDDFGNTTIKRRPSATNMAATVVMPRAQADYALASMQEVLDVPAAYIATDKPGYAGLNVFGLGSASVKYDADGASAQMTLNVQGFI